MRLLIVTQTVDKGDPVLGFFHRWIEEFAGRFERVEMICLKEGSHALPGNVSVHSLGKEKSPSRIKYLLKFYRYIFSLRSGYDAVFVHMNQEYVLLGGLFWKLMGKRIYMWRNHYAGSLLTDVAVGLCDKVFCTSKKSYTAKFKKTAFMPIGIDTSFFTPGDTAPKPHSILFLGRLDESKRPDVFIRALELLHEEGTVFSATIVGDPSNPQSKFAHDLRNLAMPLSLDGALEMRPGVTNSQARDLFRAHEVYCNLSPDGMFDKTIGEAMASGATVVCGNSGVRDVIPAELFVADADAKKVAAALKAAFNLSEPERRTLVGRERNLIASTHSLSLLSDQLASILQK